MFGKYNCTVSYPRRWVCSYIILIDVHFKVSFPICGWFLWLLTCYNLEHELPVLSVSCLAVMKYLYVTNDHSLSKDCIGNYEIIIFMFVLHENIHITRHKNIYIDVQCFIQSDKRLYWSHCSFSSSRHNYG